MSIAILERDLSHSESLRTLLESAGHTVSMFIRWTSLAAVSEQAAFEAIVLDCNDADSVDADALKHIRSLVGPAVPILVCSKRCGEMDIVDALRAGADDYLVKPLRGAELIARLEAVTRRRTRASIRLDVRQVGEFRIDCRQRTIHRNQVGIPLTSIDFELSVLFLGNVQRLLTRDHIHEVIWKSVHAVGSRTLDTHVSRVRNKLSLMPPHGWRLVSVYGYGYRLLRLEGPLAATPQLAAERASTGPAVAQHVAAA